MGVIRDERWLEDRTSDLFSNAQAFVNGMEMKSAMECEYALRDLAAAARALLRFIERSDNRKELLGW